MNLQQEDALEYIVKDYDIINAITLFLAFTAVFSSILRWTSFVWHKHTKASIWGSANKEGPKIV